MNASPRRADAVAGLQTERLDLRPLTLANAADYWPLVRDADILRHVGEAPCTSLDAVRELLRSKPLADYANHGYGRLAVIRRDDGRFVGWCGLKYLPELDEVDIGYRFLRDCWGHGYASEAGAAVLQQGFTQLGLRRIVGLVVPDNLASVRVLQKLGLRRERRLRLPLHDDEIDLYAIAATAD